MLLQPKLVGSGLAARTLCPPLPAPLRLTQLSTTPAQIGSQQSICRSSSTPAESSYTSSIRPGNGAQPTADETEPVEGHAEPLPSTEELKSHRIEITAEDEPEDFVGTKELVNELTDTTQIGQRGELWLLLQIAAVTLVFFPPLALKGLCDLLGTVLLTAGAVFIAYGFISLGRSFSPLPQPRKKHKLITTGMFAYVRHPIYSGLLLGAFGLAAVTHSEARLALSALLWWVLEQKARNEETELARRYPEYEEYRQKVNKFFPFIY